MTKEDLLKTVRDMKELWEADCLDDVKWFNDLEEGIKNLD